MVATNVFSQNIIQHILRENKPKLYFKQYLTDLCKIIFLMLGKAEYSIKYELCIYWDIMILF
jgi:hypothetical protein